MEPGSSLRAARGYDPPIGKGPPSFLETRRDSQQLLTEIGTDPQLHELPDLDLIRLTLERGDRDDRPFGELVRRHRSFVWRYCLAFFGNEQDAEDLAQDVLFTAFRKLHQFRGDASFRTWLNRIAANTCKNEIRRRSRRIRTEGDPHTDTEQALDASPGPETLANDAQKRDRLAAAGRSLPADERALLRWVEVERRPYKEIADDLDISVGAVKMRMLRARLALRGAFDALQKTEGP